MSDNASASGSKPADVNAATKRPSRPPKRTAKCRFFATKNGCRAGENCPFLHEAPPKQNDGHGASEKRVSAEQRALSGHSVNTSTIAGPITLKSSEIKQPLPSRSAEASSGIASRPVGKQELEDPRGFQISQIRRRFRPEESNGAAGETILKFKSPVTDPDFPFDLEALVCELRIPSELSSKKPPRLLVSNPEMERGYQINVEKAFDAAWASSGNPTLLNAMKALDRKLEAILTAKKADIFKIVAPAGPVQISKVDTKAKADSATGREQQIPEAPPKPSLQEIAAAKERRDTEIRMLEHRLGRHLRFSKSADGIAYTVPVEPRKRAALPVSLQALEAVRLIVPLSYDLEPCRVELMGVEGDPARNIEQTFLKRAKENQGTVLLAQVNYLAQNMHNMTAPPVENKPEEATLDPSMENTVDTAPTEKLIDTEKSHVKIIARPPEWGSTDEGHGDAHAHTDSDSHDFTASSSEYSDDEDTYDEDESNDEKKEAEDVAPSAPREKGTMISFPSLELFSIELLELTTVNLLVKCERCRDQQEIRNIKNNTRGDYTGIVSTSCKKCANPIGAGYRADLMHINSIRAGFLDLDGATAVDLLPSNFTLTCAECSTSTPPPGIVSVRGDSSMAICRECHKKMSFKIPETKFLRISAAAIKTHHGLPRKKVKENLGIVAGTELPRRGRCQHYGKSHRWFRFSCCGKVYPCDRCHDAVEKEHVQEFANRMICGFCSREQNYRPEDCAFCHKTLTGKASSGFWEGGKGTRDRKRMSRKDPRKYKRRGKPLTGANKSKD